MKKIYTLFVMIIIWLSTTYATTTSSNGYNTPIFDESLKFEAELDWSKVYTNWSVYNKDKQFVYYKVIRSQDNSNPIYPDNWYIKYITDVNKTSYIDTSPLNWTTYYRVCAITSEKNRYCSNVVKIYKEEIEAVKIWWDKDAHGCYISAWYSWCEIKSKCLRTWEEKCEKEEISQMIACTKEYVPVCWKKDWIEKSYWNKCMLKVENAIYLYSGECKTTTNTDTTNKIQEFNLEVKVEKLVNNFVIKIEKIYTTTEKRIEIINKTINKLNNLAISKPNQKQLIDFIIIKLEAKIKSYKWSDLSDIESIFNEIE